MSIKVAVLRTGDHIIADMKEVVNDDKDIVAYLFNNPNTIEINTPLLMTESGIQERKVEISLSKWILITDEEDIAVPTSHVVTIVEPLDSVIKMYEEKVNGEQGEIDQDNSSDEPTTLTE